MIKTIHDYGVCLRDEAEMAPHFSIFSPPYLVRKASNYLIYYADIQDKKFIELSSETYNESAQFLEKYLFRELASANAAPVVPSLHFFYNDKVKLEEWHNSIDKFMEKLRRCLKGNTPIFKKYFDIDALLEKLPVALKQLELKEKRNHFFTIKINGAYLGDVPEIKALLEAGAYDKYFKIKEGLCSATDKLCALTYQQVPEVWGRVSTLGFTINDIAFSRNGFNPKDSYKMFPVSPEAVKTLEGTMSILERELSFGFHNLRFFVLPRFVAVQDPEVRRDIAKFFYTTCKQSAEKARTFEGLNDSIMQSEDIFEEIRQDAALSKAGLYYDIFFYEKKQAQFAIKAHVSDILPSRFRVLLETKKQVEKRYESITEKLINKEPKPYYIHFANIKNYFSTESVFFKIVEAVFYQSKLDEEQIVKTFMQKIVIGFKNRGDKTKAYEFPDHVKHTFCIHQYFQTLQLFDNMEQNNNAKSQDNQAVTNTDAQNFVASHPTFFPASDPLKKAAFYLGCATEMVLNAQQRHLKNEPFSKNLNNLQFDYKLMQELIPKLLNKAKEYIGIEDKYGPVLRYGYFQKLMKEMALAVVDSGEEEVSKTMLSFAFSIGLIMEKEFRYAHKKDND